MYHELNESQYIPLSQSLAPIAGLIFAFGEHTILLQQPALRDPVFLFVSLLGGIIGFAISFSSLWFLSLVGSIK